MCSPKLGRPVCRFAGLPDYRIREGQLMQLESPRSPNGSAGRQRNARGQGDRLRREIIDAARDILAETGNVDRLTLREVARRVGIAATSVYLHFPDPEH